MRKRTFASWIALFGALSSIIFTTAAVCLVLFTLANFSDNIKRFSFYVRSADAEMAKKELVGLHYFYDLSRRWKVQWLADKYLFRDASFYEVADAYLIHDWRKVQDDLKDKLDDPRAYPYGNAKFREKKAQFQEKGATFEEALNFVMTEVAADYEKALRNCLDSDVPYLECYDRVWNYDLATNKKNAGDALKSPTPNVKYILGPPKTHPEPVLPPPDKAGGKEPGKEPGMPGPRKRP